LNGVYKSTIISIFCFFMAFNSYARFPFLVSSGSVIVDSVCAYKNYGAEINRIAATKMPFSDKTQHCSVSCRVGLKCGIQIISMMGVGKEAIDALPFNSGNAEILDLKADLSGILLSIRRPFLNPDQCLVKCTAWYGYKFPKK
jgi:hypothetical protein